MDLINTINSTNTQKDRLKTGKRNIDNKIISLGGTKPTNIADVPNKIQKVMEQYRKVAFVDIPQGVNIPDKYNDGAPFTGTINYNISFTPKIVVFGGTDYLGDDINTKEKSFIFTARQNITGQDWLAHPYARNYHSLNPINLKITSITNRQIQFESLGSGGYIKKLMLIG